MSGLWTPGLGRYLVSRPRDVVTLSRAGWRLRRRGWWRRPPFLPVPAKEYWEFRMKTVGVEPDGQVSPRAVLEAARWSLRQPVGR